MNTSRPTGYDLLCTELKRLVNGYRSEVGTSTTLELLPIKPSSDLEIIARQPSTRPGMLRKGKVRISPMALTSLGAQAALDQILPQLLKAAQQRSLPEVREFGPVPLLGRLDPVGQARTID